MKRSMGTFLPFCLLVLILSGTLCVTCSGAAATNGARREDTPGGGGWPRLAAILPGSAGIAFNSGVAYYRQGDYRRAAAEFSRAVRGKDPAVAAAAHYNLGNTLLRQGDALAAGDKRGAAEFYGKAAEQYEQALRVDGADPDARFNLALARGRLQALRTATRGQSGPKQGPDSNNREQGRSEERRDQGKPSAGKRDASETKRAATGDARNRSSKQAPGAGKNGNSSSQPLRMTRQDAEAFLREHRSTAGPTAIFRDAGSPGQSAPVLKDW